MRTSSCLCIGLLAVLDLGAASPLPAQGGSLLEGFRRSHDHELVIDGAADPSGEIYVSQRVPAYLGMSEELPSPFLLMPRTQRVQTVHVMKVAKRDAETVDLLQDPLMGIEGSFEVVGQELHFQVAGHDVVLREKPPLLGRQDLGGMKAYSRDYVRRAEAYTPEADAMAKLEGHGGDVRVRVFFGSWCPFCQQYVPRLMKVAEELEGSSIEVDFYGLPRDMKTDPISGEAGIKAVPTGVVWVDGREAGRIQSDQWRAPEEALVQILAR
jgi:thiol-disulfide isomerase/thioredoxin